MIVFTGCSFDKKTEISHPDIRIITPKSGENIISPLVITGEARGIWYFEADFPVFLLDENGNQIAIGIAQAQDDWMTENFVPFRAELNFDDSKKMNATLVLMKDNPSDLAEYDDELKIPVFINRD